MEDKNKYLDIGLFVILVLVLLFLAVTIVRGQDIIPINTFIESQLNIDLGVFVSQGDGNGNWGNLQTTQETEAELLQKIKEIAKIPEQDRTVEDWKELIRCIMQLSIINGKKVNELIAHLEKEIQEQQEQIALLEKVNKINKEYQDYLLGLINLYEGKLKEIEENKKPDLVFLGGGIGYGFGLNNFQVNFQLGYFHRFDFPQWLGIGTGLIFTDILNNFGLSLWLGISINF